MITTLREAIYNKGITIDGLPLFTGIDATTNNTFSIPALFFKDAPQTLPDKKPLPYPHCIFSEISNPYAGRTTATKFEESYIQASFYGLDQDVLESLAKNWRIKFDDSEKSFTLTDYYVLRVDWSLSRDMQLDDCKQIIVQHKFSLQQK
jgi:hypothetical protein